MKRLIKFLQWMGSRSGLYVMGYVLLLVSISIYGLYINKLYVLTPAVASLMNNAVEHILNIAHVFFLSGAYLLANSYKPNE